MEHDPIIITVGGVVIMILLSIVGFFLVRLITSVDNLNKTISNMNIVLVENNKDTEQLKEDFKLQNIRLNNHSKNIKKNSLNINKVSTICEMKGNLKGA